ncbi:imidazole glycerol phosphate synthase subunit HisH [Actinoplanes sp. NPDC048796]|uniref:imidazole glycerol phosphate synthase subunit HisH n=1 Tax=unclassified Actinoplanes TaxID=2626549 RepID=UPI0034098D18
MPNVVVLDYGSGNLRSAERAVARTGADTTVTSDLALAAEADGLVVPGVGAYAACMAGIDEIQAGPMIAARVAAGRPVLGICVGMQILFDSGVEHGVETKGLGLLPGVVSKLAARRIPHMGWNTVDVADDSVLLAGLDPDVRFYFVHSYGASDLDALTEAGAKVTTASHDEPFAAVVEHGALSAAQFHPEKSADAGYGLLRNWVAGLPSSDV